MTKFLSFLATRQFLAFVVLVVVALVVWFVGPFVAFGGLKPLADTSMRVLFIALLLAGMLLWLAGVSTLAVFVALLCLLIWYAAPLLSFGQAAPFEAASARAMTIAIVLVVFIAYGLLRLWRKMRDDELFLRRVLDFGGKKEASPAAASLKEVNANVTRALAHLKAMRTGAGGLGRFFQGKRYLYELPWYITLGSTSSGKTSALLRAGLALPMAEQMQRAAHGLTDSTPHVDWWLTNDAVLIDTAGHYTRHGTSSHDLLPVNPARSAGQDNDGGTAGNQADTAAVHADPAKQRIASDEAEWLGFLGLLRSHRPRAPLNGALLTVDVAELTSADASARLAEAAALRARLADLRETLGIRFPVYLLITKMDRLSGFAEYFGSLTAEGRAQVWGFTLPYGCETIAHDGIHTGCKVEMVRLVERLADGVNTRLQDEYDAGRRRKLAALSEEFGALTQPLDELIESVFADSRYDGTQSYATLRGVYFTSATQSGEQVVAERDTVVQRLAASRGHPLKTRVLQPGSNQSYFLHDLLTRLVFAEADLVRPNLRWEWRLRLLRMTGHALALLIFAWLMSGIWISFGHNRAYLDAIGRKAQTLTARVTQLYNTPKMEDVPDALTDARYLASYPGLDLAKPDSGYRFGLYAAPEVFAASGRTYDALEDNLLVPQIVRRMEAVLSQAIAGRDTKTVYDTLRVYLMLYDKAKYNAADVKVWVLDDWAHTDSAAVFGGRASMIEHVQQLFSGTRAVQSPFVRNDALIQQGRAFLDSSDATQRVYERVKAAMQIEAPDEFTLLRAVGPQAGTVFTRASGAPLSRGVPGIFTFDGYRNLFDKRLPEFVEAARQGDAWVMGRSPLGDPQNEAQKKTAEFAKATGTADDPLMEAIRRQYLNEYARQWDAYLGDIRTVAGTSLAFNLQVLRSFAAPDSPLARLARAAVHETTLTQPAAAPDTSFLEKAAGQLKNTDTALGIRSQEGIERELVDHRFAALREVVTGSADGPTASTQAQTQAGRAGLDGVASLLNDYYTALTVADNALANNSLPPASDTAARLKMMANTMPAPFREVLQNLAVQGSREVNLGIGQLLSRQIQAVVGDACRLTVEGRYPFAADSERDVSIDDFTRVFAQGGVFDDFFAKTLAPFVDTSARPWRYRILAGATEPVQGLDLASFEQAKAIREVFFGEPGQKQLSWKAEIRVAELDPAITGLMLDIDGQSMLYQHGPVTPFQMSWPGPRGGVHADFTAAPRIRPDTSTMAADGPWAFLRLLQKGRVVETAIRGRTRAEFELDGRKVVLDIASTGSVANPLTSGVLKSFRCPSSMATLTLPDTGPPPGLPPGLPPMSVKN